MTHAEQLRQIAVSIAAHNPTEAHRLFQIADQLEAQVSTTEAEWPTPTGEPPTGVQLKAEGMAKAETGLTPEYKQVFDVVIRDLAASGQSFTSEDITDVCGLPRQRGVHRNNGIGALMGAYAKKGVIVKTGERVKMRHPGSHAGETTKWIGFDYGPQEES